MCMLCVIGSLLFYGDYVMQLLLVLIKKYLCFRFHFIHFLLLLLLLDFYPVILNL